MGIRQGSRPVRTKANRREGYRWQADWIILKPCFARYTGTGKTMVVTMDDGAHRRVTSEQIRELADRLLALAYENLPVSPSIQDALFDFAREGSFAAMRELVRRFPMDEFERSCYVQVLRENEQLT